jgi:hypothetical protein
VVTTERVLVSIQVPGRGRTEQVAQLAKVTPRLGPVDRRGNRTVHLDGAVIPPLYRVAGAEQLRDLIVSAVGRQAGPRAEKTLWTGRPTVTRVWNPGDVGLFVFGCFVVVFSLVFVVVVPFVATNRDSVVLAAIFGSAGMLIGIWVSFGRTFLRGRRLKRTEYIITSDRLIIRDGREFAARLSALPFPVAQINLDGVGTIRFGNEAWEVPNGRIRRDSDRTRKFVLHAIPDAQRIHDLIVTTRTPHD